MNCPNCAAPIPANTLTCPYCHSRVSVDLKGVNFAPKVQHKTLMCPRCVDVPLEEITLEIGHQDLDIERCPNCQGLFFDPGELEFMLDQSVKHVLKIDHKKLAALSEESTIGRMKNRYLKCPHCTDLMNYYNYGGRSGVIVDWCKEHGIWLDGGELKRLLEWKKFGGEELKDNWEDAKRAEQTRQFKQKNTAPMSSFDSYDDESYDNRRRGIDIIDIAESIFDVVKHLIK
ncbi:MAG: zf-TFIIB domain-containing protein [Lentisphaerales bacterium]|nr:zf-TFIIB domain-containing protein [Lentisphaerales bacterium]